MKTLKEIAREAGVSMTTVSNVIHGNAGRVSASTIARIEEIIQKSGYVPNQAARSLAQQNSRIVAVIVQAPEGVNMFRNPYVAEYIGALTIELQRGGYYPLIRFTDNYGDVETNLRGWNAAGAIFCGAFNRKLRDVHSLSTVPTVLTDCYLDIPGANHIGLDDEAGGRLAAEYLLQMGHTRLAFIATSAQDSEVDQHRLKGFTDVLTSRGLTLPEQNILSCPESVSPENILPALFKQAESPTAVFCTADRVAALVVGELSRMGLRVPQDVSVLGFDDLPLAQMTTPPLTTIRQDIAQKAQMAVSMLLHHIADKTAAPEREVLDIRLIERASVRRLPHKEGS